MAQHLGMSLRTGQRDLQSATCAGRKRRRDRGTRRVLNPYKPSLLERWNAGCHPALQLCRDLQPQGYTGSYGRVAAYARQWRQAQGLPPAHRRPRQGLPPVVESPSQPLTPRRAPGLVLRRATPRTAAETQPLPQLHAQSREVAEAIALAQEFPPLVRQRQAERLDPWLTRAMTSRLETVQHFATGLQEDYAAVKAGVTLPWSTSPVEGPMNRLKMVKRQMFGRARLALLRHRFLRAPRTQQARAVEGPCAPSQGHAAAQAA